MSAQCGAWDDVGNCVAVNPAVTRVYAFIVVTVATFLLLAVLAVLAWSVIVTIRRPRASAIAPAAQDKAPTIYGRHDTTPIGHDS
jgi:hypothetical protein